ncbi:hypothetical protein GRF29_69g2031129 [Pseudopithomyces chartarum]|uniref:Uncharacterized protein n=1 Tax=Pseudopithomyces chartarum TaxID=1892770 RepID=A0AAN6LYJ3_9PLEO|nr:hypothetical protein GRF29_69g2031129 [Pseudopithomyces chartarum]
MKFSSLSVLFIPFLNFINFICASEIREVLGTRPPRPQYTPGVARPNRPAPSKSDWDDGENHEVRLWLKQEWDKFYYGQGDILDFPTYMRVNFAPDLAPSAYTCQALGSCSIGDCQNIRADLPQHDRQMAYWVFESIANIDLTAKTMKDVIDDVTQDIYGRSSEEISLFTWRNEAHDYEVEKQRQKELDMQIATFVLLILSALVGFAAGAVGPILGATVETVALANLGSNAVNVVSSTYIGTAGLVKQLDTTDSNYMSDVQNRFKSGWQRIAINAEYAIRDDLKAYWTGYRGKETWDKAADQMIASGSFVEFNTDFYDTVKDLTAKWFTAASIGMLWGVEQVYILDTDASGWGDCEGDSRGPPRNKVCLPERPDKTFWLYGIEPQESVASPPGLRTILENPDRYHGITKEDIIDDATCSGRDLLAKSVDALAVCTLALLVVLHLLAYLALRLLKRGQPSRDAQLVGGIDRIRDAALEPPVGKVRGEMAEEHIRNRDALQEHRKLLILDEVGRNHVTKVLACLLHPNLHPKRLTSLVQMHFVCERSRVVVLLLNAMIYGGCVGYTKASKSLALK